MHDRMRAVNRCSGMGVQVPGDWDRTGAEGLHKAALAAQGAEVREPSEQHSTRGHQACLGDWAEGEVHDCPARLRK